MAENTVSVRVGGPCALHRRGQCPHMTQHRASMRYVVDDPERVRLRTLIDLRRLGDWASRDEMHRAGHNRYSHRMRNQVLSELVSEGLVEHREPAADHRVDQWRLKSRST